MMWAQRFWLRLQTLFRRKRNAQQLDDEIQFHLEQQIAENMAADMSREEARYAAMRTFGNPTFLKEETRDTWGWIWLEQMTQDLRYGLRTLRKNPGFTAVAVLSLTLGIGANTAIFSVLESQLWRPLSFPGSEELVDVHVVLRENPEQWDVLPHRVYQAWRTQSRSLVNLAAFAYPEPRNLTANATSERVLVMPTASSFFDTLQVPL